MFLPIGPNWKVLDDPPRVWRWRAVASGLTIVLGLTERALSSLGVVIIDPNNLWLSLGAYLAVLYVSIKLVWRVESFLGRRVYRRFQAERVCIKCFYCLDHGDPENPLCPECGFSKTVSDVLRKQFRWGKWSDRTFTRREREPGK